MRKLIVANYKMNGDKKFYSLVQKNLKKLKVKDTNIVLCPPFVYLPFINVKNKAISLGVQDVSNALNTKCTGQISPIMAQEFGAVYSIVGHSERRANGETDSMVSDKVEICTNNGIVPIICVGEETKKSSLDVLDEQVKIALIKAKGKVIFAYEPVWAIGSGEVPTVAKINKAIAQIKRTAKSLNFNIQVLYGGSVNEKNYKELLTTKADGFLLGGVSLNIEKFLTIVRGVDNE